MPSIQKDIPFKPLSTADVKTLSRIGLFNDFDINNELLKLALFDKLSILGKETSGIDADSLTQIDFLSFLIGVRKLMNNSLEFSFTCRKCEKRFEKKIDLETEFSDLIFNYKKKNVVFEKMDNKNNIWKFELENYTMRSYMYYRYYLERLKDIDSGNPDVINEGTFIRPVLYIKSVSLNDEKIDDFEEQLLAQKIQFFNMLPSEIILDTKISDRVDPNACLANFVKNEFDEEKLFIAINNMTAKCPHCGTEYDGVFKVDDFFMF